jgi:DNA-binding transcriptional MocR family regulator
MRPRPGRRVTGASPIPKYHQLAAILRAEIDSGAASPGEVLPTQQALAEEFGISVDTVRDALQVLRQEGLITTVRGQGSRVRTVVERRVIPVGPGVDIWARMPTNEEKEDPELELGDGVPVLVIRRPGLPDEVVSSLGTTVRTQPETPEQDQMR